MSTGAEQAAQAETEGFGTDQHQDWLGPVSEPPELPAAVAREPESIPMPAGIRAFGALLILLALGWTGLFGWSLWQSRLPLAPAPIAGAIATFSAPLILLALIWLWLGKTPRREAERFTASVDA